MEGEGRLDGLGWDNIGVFQLKFSPGWIDKWMKEYRVSLRKPNKRFCLSHEDRKIRITDYLQNLIRVQHYFWSKYGIMVPVINGDQMPLHL